MHRRKAGREYYSFPGGRVEEGETPDQACAREVREETGIEVAVGSLLLQTQFQGAPEFFFRARYLSGDPKLGGPEAERHCEDNWYDPTWVPLEEAPHLPVLPREVADRL